MSFFCGKFGIKFVYFVHRIYSIFAYCTFFSLHYQVGVAAEGEDTYVIENIEKYYIDFFEKGPFRYIIIFVVLVKNRIS